MNKRTTSLGGKVNGLEVEAALTQVLRLNGLAHRVSDRLRLEVNDGRNEIAITELL